LAKFEKETYFTLVNVSRSTFPKGSQAWNFYGGRNNKGLMIGYGFCFSGNLYNSFEFCVSLDFDFESIESIKLKQLLAPSRMSESIT
jgi:hypothetical protein